MVKIERTIRVLSTMTRQQRAGQHARWLIPRERVRHLLGYRSEMGFRWFLKRFRIRDENGYLRADEIIAALERWQQERRSEQGFAERFDARHGAGAYQRLKEMLRTNELTFAEIGRRMGISRERIRQIALKRLGLRGRRRRAISTMASKEEKLLKQFYTKHPWFNEVLPTLQRIGRRVEIVGPNSIIVGQHRLQVREAEFKRRSLGVGPRSLYVHMSIKSAHKADFLLLRARWSTIRRGERGGRIFHYILPAHALPCSQIVIPLPLSKTWKMGYGTRTIGPETSKYFQYLEAWHLLGQPARGKTQAATPTPTYSGRLRKVSVA